MNSEVVDDGNNLTEKAADLSVEHDNRPSPILKSSHPNNCHPEQEQDQPRPSFNQVSSSHISVNEED